ncbi:hypothetical protein HK099_007664 [Clydaea vesicula]|uniref:Uncharacterized protein n=1 Tax=Clydaea vesicula TaxID=447962 RepID=A0AAD5TWV1_9FUNG|nr:hypothetical protein HK099_007664 [Clydaea vesicula]
MEINEETKPGYWSQVFNLNNKAFKRKRGVSNELSLTGMIRTDLVGISVNIDPPPTKGRRIDALDTEVYLERNTVGLIKENFVVIDPNKRDLLYCLGSNNHKLRYTQPQREMETGKKKYRKIREDATLNQRCKVDSFFGGGDRPFPFLRSNNNIPD